MKPNENSKGLEQLITRIHKHIEPKGSKVQWNGREEDPDTGRLRQIDGIIERNGVKLHIECRDHKDPQDVKWVEELIGRRLSLQVNGIIGVSSSGFTKPAWKKAAAFGVVLRTLSEMTDAEIQDWCSTVKLSAQYIEIEKFEISILISEAEIGFISQEPKLEIIGQSIHPNVLILQEVINQAQDQFSPGKIVTVTASVNFQNLLVDGAVVVKIDVLLKGMIRTEKIDVIGVWNYHGLEPLQQTEAIISRHDRGATEIIERGDTASMILDMSSISPPHNCYLCDFQVDFGRVVKATIEPLAAPQPIQFSFDTILDVKAVGTKNV